MTNPNSPRPQFSPGESPTEDVVHRIRWNNASFSLENLGAIADIIEPDAARPPTLRAEWINGSESEFNGGSGAGAVLRGIAQPESLKSVSMRATYSDDSGIYLTVTAFYQTVYSRAEHEGSVGQERLYRIRNAMSRSGGPRRGLARYIGYVPLQVLLVALAACIGAILVSLFASGSSWYYVFLGIGMAGLLLGVVLQRTERFGSARRVFVLHHSAFDLPRLASIATVAAPIIAIAAIVVSVLID